MEQSARMGTARLVRASSLACAAAALLCVLGGLVLGSPLPGGLAGLGLLIGAVAGLYPSMRAARLSPTEALRTV